MCTEFNLDGYDALVAYVIEQSLYSERGIFVEEDHLILHFMDRHYGLTPLETYNSRNPTRVSKLFHGGTMMHMMERAQLFGKISAECATQPTPHDIPFIDSHFYMDRLLEFTNFKGSLTNFSNSRAMVRNNPLFQGGITNFIDPKFFDSPIMHHILKDPLVKFSISSHPKQANRYNDNLEETIKSYICHPKLVAVGEMGLDSSVYWENNRRQEQVFKAQLDIAVEVSFPIIVHCRGSEE